MHGMLTLRITDGDARLVCDAIRTLTLLEEALVLLVAEIESLGIRLCRFE